MTLCQLTRLPPNVAGRQRVVDSDICWIFGIFLSYYGLSEKYHFGLKFTSFIFINVRNENFLEGQWEYLFGAHSE